MQREDPAELGFAGAERCQNPDSWMLNASPIDSVKFAAMSNTNARPKRAGRSPGTIASVKRLLIVDEATACVQDREFRLPGA
jgi:hypothetical protein